MNEKVKNIIIIIVCVLLVGFDIFALSLKPSKKDENKTSEIQETTHEPIVPVSEQVNPVTDKFFVNGYMTINGNTTYLTKSTSKKELNIDATKCNIPSSLTDYKADIYFEITYSGDDNTVYDVHVFNKENDTEVIDLSEENIKKTFDIAYNKQVNNATWSDKVNLSDLKENEIYLYKATSPSNNAPEINNDTDSNCLVYTRSTKNNSKGEWSKEISTFVTFKSNSLSISYNSFKTGDTYEIIYKKINNNELLNLTSSGEVIYLSDYQNDDSIKSNFAKYIYNNTEKDITIETTSNAFGVSTNNSKTIPAGAIYGYDWMLSNAKVKIN